MSQSCDVYRSFHAMTDALVWEIENIWFVFEILLLNVAFMDEKKNKLKITKEINRQP